LATAPTIGPTPAVQPRVGGGKATRRGRRVALAITAGLLLYAGHPPLDVGLVGVVALVPLLLLSRDIARGPRPLRTGLGWGLVAGLVFFGPLLSWVFRFGAIAWGLLVGVQAAWVALFVGAVAWFGERRGRAVFAVALWVALEAGRSLWPLGGFGWGVLGYTQHAGGMVLPVARTLGVLGISAVLAAVAACLEEIGVRVARVWPRMRSGDDGLSDTLFTAARTPLLTLLFILVAVVLLAGEPPAATGRTIDIAAVQASDIQYTYAAGSPTISRLDPARIKRVAQQMALATLPLTDDPPAVTVWPENSLDADYTDPANAELRALVASTLALLDGGTLLADGLLDGPEPGTLLHAIMQIAPDGEVVDRYVKRQPIPFGEYVPFRQWLGWFPPLQQIPRDQIPGDEPGVFEIAGDRIGAVICYESISPRLVHSTVRAGAEVLVVSTNNTSFSPSPMSRQHLAFSQLRAVETGRWILHAGISGISGIVDPEGDVHQRTAQFQQAVVRANLPLVTGVTPATFLAGWVGWAATLIAALALTAGLISRDR
jgi:apolipoprotein N-acyltransferase